MANANGLPPNQRTRLEVLIVENDAATARLTREAFREVGVTDGIRSVSDGEDALAALRSEGHFEGGPKPNLIFLDLHLPRVSGMEVLREIKMNPNLKVTPVVVVSGSSDPKEIREAYELHANCYIRKPDDLHQFLRFVSVCFDFWGSLVALPD